MPVWVGRVYQEGWLAFLRGRWRWSMAAMGTPGVPVAPQMIGDVGQDDAYATESNPEGLRYGEGPHAPGCLAHPAARPRSDPPNGDISIG
jgi:hypothetical protein